LRESTRRAQDGDRVIEVERHRARSASTRSGPRARSTTPRTPTGSGATTGSSASRPTRAASSTWSERHLVYYKDVYQRRKPRPHPGKSSARARGSARRRRPVGGQLGAKPGPLLLDERARVPGDRRGEALRGRPSLEHLDRSRGSRWPSRRSGWKQARAQRRLTSSTRPPPEHGVDPGDQCGPPGRGRGKLEAHEPDVPAGEGGARSKVGGQLGQRPSRGKAAPSALATRRGFAVSRPPRPPGLSRPSSATRPAALRRPSWPSTGPGPRRAPPGRRRRARRTTSGRTRSRPRPAPRAPDFGCPRRPAPSRSRGRRSSARSRPGCRSGGGARGGAPRGRLGRADVHSPVEEERVAGDDLRRVGLGPPERPLGLADRRAPREDVQHPARLADPLTAAPANAPPADRRGCARAPSRRRAPCPPRRRVRRSGLASAGSSADARARGHGQADPRTDVDRRPTPSAMARRATSRAEAPSVWTRMSANSSPPMRAARSTVRMEPAILRAASLRTASPAGCPWVSLTDLKWSRSMIARASGCPNRRSAPPPRRGSGRTPAGSGGP
jgi:hypothetical protein